MDVHRLSFWKQPAKRNERGEKGGPCCFVLRPAMPSHCLNGSREMAMFSVSVDREIGRFDVSKTRRDGSDEVDGGGWMGTERAELA